MRVEEIWRYPVKSLQGERVSSSEVTDGGLRGDRGAAIFDVETGLGLTARRVPELLFAFARIGADGEVSIEAPDGSVLAGDGDLSAWLGRPVELRVAGAVAAPRYENVNDTEDESRGWYAFEGSAGPFHDSTSAKLTLVSRATLGGWETRRFRPNLVLSGDGEDELVGSSIAIGGCLLRITEAVPRCVMVTRPQPEGIDADPGVLRTVARERGNRLAIAAIVERGGTIAVGDEVLAA